MKYNKQQIEKLFKTKLANRLSDCNLSDVTELRYISERDFRKHRYVGKDLVEYAREELAKRGLKFGNYTIEYYLSQRNGGRDLDAPIVTEEQRKAQEADESYWRNFRALAAKDLIPFAAQMKDYRYYPGGIIQEAIFLADELIRQLKGETK